MRRTDTMSRASAHTITVNGEHEPLDDACTVGDLLDRKALRGKRIAVERNGDIVPRSVFDHTALSPGDRIEIVIAVGGG